MLAVLFRNLQDEVQGLFGDAGQVDFSERSILFVDQAVSIVKHILESPQVILPNLRVEQKYLAVF